MRGFIHYIRQCFCKHNFLFEEKMIKVDFAGTMPMVSATCNKCAYHKSYWKYTKPYILF